MCPWRYPGWQSAAAPRVIRGTSPSPPGASGARNRGLPVTPRASQTHTGRNQAARAGDVRERWRRPGAGRLRACHRSTSKFRDDARELARDVLAYHRELRSRRRRRLARRFDGPITRDGMVLPLSAGCLALTLVAATLLTVFTARQPIVSPRPPRAATNSQFRRRQPGSGGQSGGRGADEHDAVRRRRAGTADQPARPRAGARAWSRAAAGACPTSRNLLARRSGPVLRSTSWACTTPRCAA